MGTERYEVGLIGAGIGSSLSPPLHEREAAELGVDYAYRLFDIDDGDEDVGELLEQARRAGFPRRQRHAPVQAGGGPPPRRPLR